ncbi:MAG: universal stress protein [Bacteroidota bacterium]
MKTHKFKKVLIALDYDPSAQKVAETGFSLAKSIGAEVVLIHVISDPLNYSLTGHITVMGFAGYPATNILTTDDIDDLKKTSQHFLDKSKLHLGDKNIKTIVKEGDIAEFILKSAEDMHADIIVIGSHSRKWLEDIVMGSVTEKVLHRTSLPLYIVPTKQKK